MRLYRARIRIRKEEWEGADAVLGEMLKERPGDVGVLHAMGWRQLRQGKLEKALQIFTGIISRREHVASLRDSAECLHRLKRNDEALKFLGRAKARESENPFVLDLESRILEDMEQLDPAYESALLASARDPLNGHMHHRLGLIRKKQGRTEDAIPHFLKSIEVEADQFGPANSLVSAYLDLGDARAAEEVMKTLGEKARTPADRALVEHARARIAYATGDLPESQKILRREIASSRNLIPNLGLLTQVECALFDENIGRFPAIAAVALSAAEQALSRIEEVDPTNKLTVVLSAKVEERRRRK
jgi:tetratricopeptide (TPR) repeat protein